MGAAVSVRRTPRVSQRGAMASARAADGELRAHGRAGRGEGAPAEAEASSGAATPPPPEYEAARAHVAACAQAKAAGKAAPAPPFARGSDAFWWHEVLRAAPPHAGVYDGPRPLIAPRGVNLSRTPREEAERRGVVAWADWSSADEAVLAAPGAGVRLRGLSTAMLNGRLGRVLPREGPGAPEEAAAPGRVAVRLAGAKQQVLSVRLACLSPAFVLAAPQRTPTHRPLPAWAPADAAAAAAACARFADAPLPPEAPTGVFSVGLQRSAACAACRARRWAAASSRRRGTCRRRIRARSSCRASAPSTLTWQRIWRRPA